MPPSPARACKILATLGPASDSRKGIADMIAAGADAFRVNMSHGDQAAHAAVIARVREEAAAQNRHVAILCDLQGPKLRLGKLPGDGVTVKPLQRLRLSLGEHADAGALCAPHPELFAALEEGARLSFDDGMVMARVAQAGKDFAELEFLNGGTLTANKGINVPGRELPLSALTQKDRADLSFALAQGADYVALSFVQRPDDVREAQALLDGRARLVAKIEKPAALAHLEEIAALADAVMVARGDLGVELDLEQVPVMQRRIIRVCRRAGRPVIVATQMLQSMITAQSPTRAEASDIATAVYLGADAVMLSAETAVGRHPLTSVAIMKRIIAAVEADPEYRRHLPPLDDPDRGADAGALAYAARMAAEAQGARVMLAFTQSGASALAIARERPEARIIAVSPSDASARRLALVWGVEPQARPGAESFDAAIAQARAVLQDIGERRRALMIAGLPFGSEGRTNVLHILD